MSLPEAIAFWIFIGMTAGFLAWAVWLALRR